MRASPWWFPLFQHRSRALSFATTAAAVAAGVVAPAAYLLGTTFCYWLTAPPTKNDSDCNNMIVVKLIAGLAALVLGADMLVRGATRLAAAWGVSPLLVGLTIVAFGTSAPELAVSVSSGLSGQAEIALGNVLGSNIFNVLFILGISAVVVPLVVDQKLVRLDVPLMIGISAATLGFAADGRVGRLEGLVLVAGLAAYVGWCILAGRKEPPPVQAEYDIAFGEHRGRDPETNLLSGTLQWACQAGLIVGGLILLVAGSIWFVGGAADIARYWGVSELVVGLTIVAGGTSLPELATSVVAAIRGERDIAVGNVVGSNIFNLLGVLGLTAVVAPDGVAVSPQALRFDIPVMLATAVACLPVFFTGHCIARWEGALFSGYYAAYTATLVMMATQSDSLAIFRPLMLGLVLPLTAITLAVIAVRAKRTSPPLRTNSATEPR